MIRIVPNAIEEFRDFTNCADDRGATIIGLWLELSVKAGEPLNLALPTGQMSQCVCHDVLLRMVCGCILFQRLEKKVGYQQRE